jgi:SAM-dependent methyltransferase
MNIPSFTQVAGNLANMGYYPTTEADCRAIATHLNGYSFTMLDPCCGTGDALKTITANMQGYGEALGIEIEEGRAEEAKGNLNDVINEDFFALHIENGSFGAIFLNPPYFKTEALHQPFIEKATDILAVEGILILIIPVYELSGKTAAFLSSFYEDFRVFRTIDQRFQQAVLFGKKRKKPVIKDGDEIEAMGHAAVQIGRIGPYDLKYEIPVTKSVQDIRIIHKGIDPERLKLELDRFTEDWEKITALIPDNALVRTPLLPLRKGHLAQVLASGLVDGVVEDKETGKRYLIKGTTTRVEEVIEETEEEIKTVNKDVVTILMMDESGTIEKIK